MPTATMTSNTPIPASRDEPLVSIGLPTFNRALSLTKAIKSVLDQEYSNLELVISDNASADNTREICELFSRSDGRVRYFRQSNNMGAVANFEFAKQAATGKYFMWLADDDWMDPNYISDCAKILDSQPDCSVACGRARYYKNRNLAFLEDEMNIVDAQDYLRVVLFFESILYAGIIYGLMRRETLLQLSILGVIGGDWLLLSKLACVGKMVTLETTALHRSLDGASSSYRELAAQLGTGSLSWRLPHAMIALHLSRQIFSREHPYQHWSWATRCRISLSVLVIMIRRFEYPRIRPLLRAFARRIVPRMLHD